MRIFKKTLLPRYEIDERDLFVGLHIHKTAGMTLLEQVKNQLRKDQYYINSMYAVNFKENCTELEERLPDKLKNIRFVFGHEINEYMLTFFKDREIKLFTFLREPIDRIVSWYCYDRKLRQQFGHKVEGFDKFYNEFFPRHSLCSMITRAFPTLIDSPDEPQYLRAISVLRKFYFVATIEDFSKKSPILFNKLGIKFSEKMRKNRTNYKRELDFEDQIDFNFLREDNLDDIKMYEAVLKMRDSGYLNYLGFDNHGYNEGMKAISSKKINPFETLLRSYLGPIKYNYKLEKIYDGALSTYEKEFLNLLIKLYALEEYESKKKYYRELLLVLDKKFDMGLATFLS